MMKKLKTDFETEFWQSTSKPTALSVMQAFFKMDRLPVVKEKLSDIITWSEKSEILLKEDPSVIFHFYLCLRSFLRAAHTFHQTGLPNKLNKHVACHCGMSHSSLTNREAKNPADVFHNAFNEFSLKEFEYYLTDSVYYAFSSYQNEHGGISIFIHLTKMLDAACIIVQRAQAD